MTSMNRNGNGLSRRSHGQKREISTTRNVQFKQHQGSYQQMYQSTNISIARKCVKISEGENSKLPDFKF